MKVIQQRQPQHLARAVERPKRFQHVQTPADGPGSVVPFQVWGFSNRQGFWGEAPLPPCAAGEGGRWLDPERVWLQANDPCRLVRQVKVVVG